MSYFVVDVESDGPIPSDFSMVCFGACRVDSELLTTFYGETKPITKRFQPEALAISGFKREEHEKFGNPIDVMVEFKEWIEKVNISGRPTFITDNNGYDFAWINWYMHHFTGSNPFGFSSRRIGDLWCGYKNDMYARWKWMRETKHTHNPVDDAKGNAEALFAMKKKGLKINIK